MHILPSFPWRIHVTRRTETQSEKRENEDEVLMIFLILKHCRRLIVRPRYAYSYEVPKSDELRLTVCLCIQSAAISVYNYLTKAS